MKTVTSMFHSCALAGAVLLSAATASAGGLSEVTLAGPFPWGSRDIHVVESGGVSAAAAVVTGTVAVAESAELDASAPATTARLAFKGGVPHLCTPSAGWTALAGGTALGGTAAYRMVFDLAADRVACTVGDWSVGWTAFGGGDRLLGYVELASPDARIFTGTRVPPAYDPAAVQTEWTLASKSGYVELTEKVSSGTAWKFKLTTAGVLSVTVKGTSAGLNFRTLPSGAPAVTAVADGFLAGDTAVTAVYLPASVASVGANAFAGCTALRVCDVPEDSQIATIGSQAFADCPALVEFRFTERLTTLAASGAGVGAFTGDTAMEIVGPALPKSLTTLQGLAISGCPNAIVGRLELGGDAADIAVSDGAEMFKDMTGITGVVFGKGVTGFAAANAFSGCTGIARITSRNPDGFNFGTAGFATLANLTEVDLHGWPTGKVPANGYSLRVLAPCDDATWQGLVASGTSTFTPWSKLSDAARNTYWSHFPTNATDEVLVPEGRIAGTSGTKTYAGATFGYGTWVVYDKGFKSLTVKGSAGNLAPGEGEPAFSPAYGTTTHIAQTLGVRFDCTAPRTVDDGLVVYEVTGYVLRAKGEDGAYTVVRQGEFAGSAARTFNFDTTELDADAYELTWVMTRSGYLEPQTEWTWDEESGSLTESVAEGTAWVFKLTAAGELSVVTRGDSRGLNLRTLPEGAAVKSLARNFLSQCATVVAVYLPASLEAIGAAAFHGCANLALVDLPADSALTTLGTAGVEEGAFEGDPQLEIAGPALPAGVTNLYGGAISGCPNAIRGRLTLGGDDVADLVCSGKEMFENLTGITELVFGAGVSGFAAENSFGGCTGITNLVCRNPRGFAFGDGFAALENLGQYDLCGWPTGVLTANGGRLRILAPRDNANWLRLVHGGSGDFETWDSLSEAERAEYRENFPGGAEPVGRIAAGEGTVAFAGCTFGRGTWIVFDKGEEVAQKSLVVKGDPADYAPEAGEVEFSPAYGYTYSATHAYGASFDCLAPCIAADGDTLYQVTGYVIKSKDASGEFTVVEKSGTFEGIETRMFVFDSDELPGDAYELTWTMARLGTNPPATQWTRTRSGTTDTLTETGIPEDQKPWIFALTSAGKLTVKQTGESVALNLRDLPSGAYTVKTLTGSFMKSCTTIQEVYLPASVTTLDSYAFYGCSNLLVCDLPEDSQLATINTYAFNGCSQLRRLRFTERLKSLYSSSSNAGLITSCTRLRIDGPTMPDSLTTLRGQVLKNSPNAIRGRLTLGGGDTTDITYMGGTYVQYTFSGCTGITEVLFGAGVTKFHCPYSSSGFSGCKGITNIVCRNPAGFDFGKSLSTSLTNVRQYDFYGWPTGTLRTKNTGTRLLAPSGSAEWQALVDSTAFTAWDELTEDQQNTYWSNFPAAEEGETLTPAGRIAGSSGTQTYAGLTVGCGVWVVFDKVQKPARKSLTVKGDPGDYAAGAGETAFSPAYGYIYDVAESCGTNFYCKAPRYAVDGADRYEVTGYTLREPGTNGTFSVVTQSGAFSGEEVRRFRFEYSALTNDQYELTWTMTPAGVVEPETGWTWDSDAGRLVEQVATGTPWVFAISGEGDISVVTRGTSSELTFQTLPESATAIRSVASNFLCQCETVTVLHFPASLERIGENAFLDCSALEIFDLPEDSLLAEVGSLAFGGCTLLREFRFTERLTTLGTPGSAGAAFDGCVELAIVGPTLPASLTELNGAAISDCPQAVTGTLAIGGDTGDVDSEECNDAFADLTGVTEVAFGAGVTGFAGANAFAGCTAITNVICRNPAGFDFGTGFAALAGLRQYEFYGWPTGKLVGNGYATRILAPRDNATWRRLVAGSGSVVAWEDMTPAEQSTYWSNFPTNAAETALVPAGRIAGTSGTQTYAGATFGYGTWIVFDKGEAAEVKSLTVKGDPADYAAYAGETPFSPGYGVNEDVVWQYGASFACTAPRYAVDGADRYEVTGYALRERDAAGKFTILTREGSFSGTAARTCQFDSSVLTNTDYELTWKMTAAGTIVPTTAWTWDSSSRRLAESVAEGTPWEFALSSDGELSVVTRGDSIALTFRTATEVSSLIKSVASNFLSQCSTVAVLYFPASLRKIGERAFYGCTGLRAFDLPADSQLAEIGTLAFGGCTALGSFRFTDRLTTLGTPGGEGGAFDGCTALTILGATLPTSVTALHGAGIAASPLAVDGRLTIGADGAESAFAGCTGAFRDMTRVTEVVFGAGVTGFAGANAFAGCTALTNVVCRNPDGFDFGDGFASLANLAQYDFYGWPSGKVVATAYSTRLLVPRDNANWRDLVTDKTAFLAWQDMTEAQQATYWSHWPAGEGEAVVPAGRIAGTKTDTTRTFAGTTFGYGTWVVFDKGEVTATKSMSVKGDPADYAPDSGEPAFSPAYGVTADVLITHGTNFVCTAPRFTVDGETLWQVTGYALRERDQAGKFSILTREFAFSGAAPREFTFDASVMTNDAYELTWKMAKVGATLPDTQWTWTWTTESSTYGHLTEVVTDRRTPWKFKLTSGGTLTVAQTVDSTSSTKINLRTLPTGCPYAIKALGNSTTGSDYFMANKSGYSWSGAMSMAAGSIIEEIYFPDTLQTVCNYAFAGCTNLVVCDFTENSQLSTIKCYSFWGNSRLRELRLTDRLTRLEAGTANTGTIVSCPKLKIVGSTLSPNLTYMARGAIMSCANAIQGRLTLGGDDQNITYSYGKYMFKGMSTITEVVFGRAVTTFASSYAFYDCTGITNIVCRNPNGFNFGTYFSSMPNNVCRYEFYGWPTGTLRTKNTGTRIYAPYGNATWRALVADATVFTPWKELTEAQQDIYWKNFYGDYWETAKAQAAVGKVKRPAGRIAGASGTKTYEGLTVGYGVWVIFKPDWGSMFFIL